MFFLFNHEKIEFKQSIVYVTLFFPTVNMTHEQSYNSPVQIENIRLGIVCPMANERDTAEDFIRAVLDNCIGFKEVIFFVIFDKSCKDGTYDSLNNLQNKPMELHVIWADENTCVVDAYIRGYKEAIDSESDWILEIDAGFSHQPEEIPKFIKKRLKGMNVYLAAGFVREAVLHKVLSEGS